MQSSYLFGWGGSICDGEERRDLRFRVTTSLELLTAIVVAIAAHLR